MGIYYASFSSLRTSTTFKQNLDITCGEWIKQYKSVYFEVLKIVHVYNN